MIEFFLAIGLVVFIFGFLVFVHEGGHFVAAIMNGVVVEEFALGFGPKIIGKKIGNTHYKLNLIPLGGYVKMFGDEDPSSFKQSAQSKADPRSLASKKPWQKLIVISGGVFVNIITAFIIFYIYLFIVDFKPAPILNITDYNFIGAEQTQKELYFSLDENSPAEKAGLPPTAFLLSVGGQEYTTKEALNNLLRDYANKSIEIKVLTYDTQEEKTFSLDLGEKSLDGEVKIGIYPISSFDLPQWDEGDDEKLFYILDEDNTESSAYKASLPKKGYINQIGDKKITNRESLEEALNTNENKEVVFQVLNDFAEMIEYNVQLGAKNEDDGNVKVGIFVITKDVVDSINSPEFYVVDYSNSKLTAGIAHTYNTTVYQAIGLGQIIGKAFQGDGEQLAQSVASPIKVTEVVYDLVSVKDFLNILNLTALISATLAFMNMLPIPLLDGGQFVITLIEWVRGKPLPEKVQDFLGKIGFGFIVGLGVVVLLKDFWQVIIQRIF